jgi:hypothetical protein
MTCYTVVEINENATIPGAEAMNHQIGEFAVDNGVKPWRAGEPE